LQEKELIEQGLWEFYNKFVHPLIPIFIKTQIDGVKIDLDKREEAKQFIEKELAVTSKLLDEVVGYEVNVMSPKQLKELL